MRAVAANPDRATIVRRSPTVGHLGPNAIGILPFLPERWRAVAQVVRHSDWPAVDSRGSGDPLEGCSRRLLDDLSV